MCIDKRYKLRQCGFVGCNIGSKSSQWIWFTITFHQNKTNQPLNPLSSSIFALCLFIITYLTDTCACYIIIPIQCNTPTIICVNPGGYQPIAKLAFADTKCSLPIPQYYIDNGSFRDMHFASNYYIKNSPLSTCIYQNAFSHTLIVLHASYF